MIGTRVFDATDQRRFAELSGDANPIHLDALAARRTPAGGSVAHGMHVVLWALDALVAAGRIAAPVAALDVRFIKFVRTGAGVTLRVARECASSLRAEIAVDGMIAIRIECALGPPRAAPRDSCDAVEDVVLGDRPAVLRLAQTSGRAGVLPSLEPGTLGALFPRAALRLGAERVAALVRLSALVGMVCPGLYGIFGGLRVAAVAQATDRSRVRFAVERADERIGMVTIAVGGAGIAGVVTAFVRRPPAAGAPLSAVARQVEPDEFASATALVVGGSRGLGAAAARIIAAGGGRVAITYQIGEDDARAVADEIGLRARVLRYDARHDAAAQLAALDWDVSHLYYFATSQIFRQKARWWDGELFAEFCELYVHGFARVCDALLARGGTLGACYPSSVAVERHPRELTEYGMAKAAGEMLCADMNRFEPRARVLVTRLPRADTDQTASLVAVPSADPVELLLPVVRELHALHGARA